MSAGHGFRSGHCRGGINRPVPSIGERPTAEYADLAVLFGMPREAARPRPGPQRCEKPRLQAGPLLHLCGHGRQQDAGAWCNVTACCTMGESEGAGIITAARRRCKCLSARVATRHAGCPCRTPRGEGDSQLIRTPGTRAAHFAERETLCHPLGSAPAASRNRTTPVAPATMPADMSPIMKQRFTMPSCIPCRLSQEVTQGQTTSQGMARGETQQGHAVGSLIIRHLQRWHRTTSQSSRSARCSSRQHPRGLSVPWLSRLQCCLTPALGYRTSR